MGLRSSKEDHSDRPIIAVHGRLYRILEMIGQGGAATVYRCEDQNAMEYALKIFDFSHSSRMKAIQRVRNFNKEARMLKYLSRRSSHFVRLYDYEYDKMERVGYMIMELGECSLRDQLTGSPVSSPFRRMYWKQIVAILKDLQDARVVHADIKPDNLIFVNNVLKLTDLGIAFRMNGRTNLVRRGRVQGTLDYMAPEVFSHQTGFKSDVWSAGVILYEMTYGHPPYSSFFNQNQKAAAIASRVPIQLPPVRDRYVADCIRRCLQSNAYARPNAYQLIAHPYSRM